MTNHRIVHHSVNHEGVTAPHSLWKGIEAPSPEQITATQHSVQNFSEEHGRDPFAQHIDDILLVQKQRTPALLGWKTIQVVNIFDTIDDK